MKKEFKLTHILSLTVFILIFTILSTLFIINITSAQSFPQPYDKYVNDYPGFLTQVEADSLRSLFASVEQETTAEVVLVVVNSTEGYTPQEYATSLGEQWGVGKADKDNGVIILYSTSENKIFVATGYGVEGVFPDSKIGRYLDDYYVPQRDSGNISQGIILFSEAFADELLINKEELLSDQRRTDISPFYNILSLIILFFIIKIIFSSLNYKNHKKKHPKDSFWKYVLLYSLLSSGRNTGVGGGGFSGGGGFGGGGFGGGGAGR